MLLDEGDGVAHFLGGVLLHVVLAVAQRGGELEHGDAILKLEPLGDDAVAEERAVAGGVALHGAGADTGASSSMETPTSASGIGHTSPARPNCCATSM